MKNVFAFMLPFFLSLSATLQARCGGKVDIGAAFAHIDVLESGKTVHTMDMPAIKADATIVLDCGICFKPTFLYGSNQGTLITGGLGLGQCIPFFEKRLTITPYAGVNFTRVRTSFNVDLEVPVPLPEGVPEDLLPSDFPSTIEIEYRVQERFRSVSPYLALEVSYNFAKNWRICGLYQYAWSRTHTKIKGLGSDKSNSKGPNYALMVEYDITDKWSIHVGAAYNITLTKEKHGLRGAGCKLGIARWF